MAYQPGTPVKSFVDVWREIQKIAIALVSPTVNHIEFTVHYEAPDKPRIGHLYYADGTSWMSSGGEGLYLYTSTGYVKQ